MSNDQDCHLVLESFLSPAKRPLVVVLGPTAGGKTALSIKLAQQCNGEVVNADSRQLYRHLNIGTAKITPEEMDGVPHHLIDVLDPKEEATAGWYQVEAQAAIEDIQQRGRVPLLVGGSMLYVSAIIDDLSLAPDPDSALRERLMAEYERDAGQSLYARLQAIDPESAERIHPNNKPRLVRAVEIFELTRRPKSQAVPQTELRPSGEDALPQHSQYDLLIFGVQWPREQLMDRINARAKMMFSHGWAEEVQGLLDRGYGPDDPGMKSHGYREIMQFLTAGEPGSVEELQTIIAAKTRQYAKRQLTWWKGDERIRWLPMQPADSGTA